MMQQIKDFIESILNKDHLPIWCTMLITGILTFSGTYFFVHKPAMEKMETKIQILDEKIEKKDDRIRKVELANLKLNEQGSKLIVKDGKIEQSQTMISGLNNSINQCFGEKALLDSKIKDLNNTIDQKDKVIENFNVNEPIISQIKALQKERYDLLHPWMITSKKNDEEVDKKAKELNEQIIALQKSITCKS